MHEVSQALERAWARSAAYQTSLLPRVYTLKTVENIVPMDTSWFMGPQHVKQGHASENVEMLLMTEGRCPTYGCLWLQNSHQPQTTIVPSIVIIATMIVVSFIVARAAIIIKVIGTFDKCGQVVVQDILSVGSNMHPWGSEPVVEVRRLWKGKPLVLYASPLLSCHMGIQ